MTLTLFDLFVDELKGQQLFHANYRKDEWRAHFHVLCVDITDISFVFNVTMLFCFSELCIICTFTYNLFTLKTILLKKNLKKSILPSISLQTWNSFPWYANINNLNNLCIFF